MGVLVALLALSLTGCPGPSAPIQTTGGDGVEIAGEPADVAPPEAVAVPVEAAIPEAAEPLGPEVVSAPPATATPSQQPAGSTKESIYATCGDRVELPQADGECAKDEDCATAGCSSEVCTTVAGASEAMTPCDIKPCFQVLDTCGCHDGHCSWTLKEPVSRMKPIRLPSQ